MMRIMMPSHESQSPLQETLAAAVAAVREKSGLEPELGLILGSGLGPLADAIDVDAVLPYGELPGFAPSTAPGHAGELVLGTLSGRRVVAMKGRLHFYEGVGAAQAAFPVRLMRALGASTLLVSNACGGLNPHWRAGELMMQLDLINFTFAHPLVGPNDPRLGPRYTDMSEAYSRDLRKLARRVAGDIGSPLAEGVYMGLLGPSFQTPAEVRMAKSLGADAVGMSTVLEVIAAKHAGMRVVAISCITDVATGTPPPQQEASPIPHEVLRQLAALVRGIVGGYKPPSPTVDIEKIITRRK